MNQSVQERFKKGLPKVTETDKLTDDPILLSDSHIALFGENIDKIGVAELSEYEEAECVGSYRLGDEGMKGGVDCSGFQAGDPINWISDIFIDQVAEKVFEISEEEIRDSARVNPDYWDGPVIFDDPNSEWGVIISPFIGPDEVPEK